MSTGLSTPPQSTDNRGINTKSRNSNLELYRIIVMLLIIAHHYVVNSGLIQHIQETGLSLSSSVMVLFGAWGKTGINCFVLITCYFMCKSKFTLSKLLKLYLQIVFYGITIYGIFLLTGHETLSPISSFFKIFPIKSISTDFVSCFLLFYLFIPFLNILIQNLSKRAHSYLVCLLIFIYTIVPTLPTISISLNYVEWFVALYFIASYLRLYSADFNVSHKQWGVMSLISLGVSCLSVFCLFYLW